MITTCTNCQARYQLDAERVPARIIKVRCPSCSGVFTLDGTKFKAETPQEEPLAVSTGFDTYHQSETATPQEPAAQDPAPDVAVASHESEPVVEKTEEPVADSASVDPVAPSDAGATSAPSVSVEPAREPATETATAVMDTPADPSPRRRKSKEEMLARALVSDIMVYNRDLYDQARADNNLLDALGAEIKKSWELYKEKVGPDVANESDHFRDALNEILADGEKIF